MGARKQLQIKVIDLKQTVRGLGVAKSLFRAPAQRFLEKAGQAFVQRRIETTCGDGDLVFNDQRICRAVAPRRWNTGDEFMEDDGRCILFCMQVPAALWALWALREERIEIRPRSRLDVFRSGAGEGEIEQDKTQTAAAASRCNTDIVGLDIALGDACSSR